MTSKENRPSVAGPDSVNEDTAQFSPYRRHEEPTRRRAAAVRLPGGDPEKPGTRYHRPSIGAHLDPIGKALLADALARSEAA